MNGLFAVDVFAATNHLAIASHDGIAWVSARLLRDGYLTMSVAGECEGEIPPEVRLGPYPPKKPVDVLVAPQCEDVEQCSLWLIPSCLMFGIGCRRGKSEEELEAFVRETLELAKLSWAAVAGIASVDVKADEAGILALAEGQNGKITVDEVEKYFEEDGLSQEQMNLVCDYLLSMKMAVVGYKQTGGTVKEAEKEEKQPLSAEEQKYVEEYLRGLGDMKEETQEEVRMAYYLPKVVEEAVRLHHPEVFIGDMIQEGNIALMVALKEIPKEKDEEEILEQVRAGMMASLESQTEVKRRDHKMVEKVTELDEAIKSMKEEYGRKVSVDEVAERLGISEDEIEDILKLAGEEVKDEE